MKKMFITFKKVLSLIITVTVILTIVVPIGSVQAEVANEVSVSGEAPGLIGKDTVTKGNWEGNYGKDAYVLFGYSYTGTLVKDGRLDAMKYDLVNNGTALQSLQYAIRGPLWYNPSNSGAATLKKPAGSSNPNTFDVYTAGGSPGEFTVKFTDNGPYQFTMYSNMITQNDYYFTFYNMDGSIMIPKQITAKDTFAGGAYLSFIVTGSFKLVLDKADSDMGFGLQGFFFDKLQPNNTSNITAEFLEPRSALLNWQNSDSDTQVVVMRKEGENSGYLPVAVVQAGTNSYFDKDLKTGTTYTYKTRTQKGNLYSSLSTEQAIVNTPAYSETILKLDKDAYEYEDANAEYIINATLTDKDGVPISNKKISFNLAGDIVGSVTSGVLGEAVTNSEGVAEFRLAPQYMGKFELIARFAVDDENRISAAETKVSLLVGVSQWKKAPVILKVSDAVKPGGLFSINGYGFNFGNESSIMAVNSVDSSLQPPENAIQIPVVQRDSRDGYYVVGELPSTVEAGLYTVWVKNDTGWSKPIVLNSPRPLFMSEYEAWNGQIIEISGRNLLGEQFGMQSQTLVRLVSGDKIVEQTVQNKTPYSIKFAVSGDEGIYNVEVSNNNGVSWAPLSSGQTLTIVPKGNDPLNLGVAWAGKFNWDNRFNVLDYGAIANDTGDDTAALNAAIGAAKSVGGGVVYLPEGSYYIGHIPMPSGIVILGDGKDKTVLYYNDQKKNMFESSGDGTTRGLQGFSGFSIYLADQTKRPDVFFWLGHPWGNEAYDMALRKPDEIFIHNIKLSFDTETGYGQVSPDPFSGMRGLAVVLISRQRFVLHDNDFRGYSASICNAYTNEYASYRGNTFRYTYQGYVQSTANYFFAENNDITGAGCFLNSKVESHGLFARANAHMENNTVRNVGSDQNDGETYCSEVPNGYHNAGRVINSSANTITTLPLKPYTYIKNMYNNISVLIIHGQGLGQLREVESIDGNVITLKKAWDIQPNGESLFTLISPNGNFTVYNNHSENSTKGIYIYGNAHDSVAANNTHENTEGIFVWSALAKGSNMAVPSFFVDIRDNEINGVSPITNTAGVLINTQRQGTSGKYYGVYVYNVEIRNNKIVGDPTAVPRSKTEAPPDSGIVSWSGQKSSERITDGYSGDATNILAENNNLNSLKHGASLSLGDYGHILSRNSYTNVEQEIYIQGAGQPEELLVLPGNAVVDVSTLQKMIDAALLLNESEYTPESWQIFINSLNLAQQVICAADMQLKVENAIVALKNSVDNLRKKVPVQSIILSASKVKLTKGDSETLVATILPENTYDKGVIWVSDNPKVATVDSSGKVTAIKPGVAIITAKSSWNEAITASCKVSVNSAGGNK